MQHMLLSFRKKLNGRSDVIEQVVEFKYRYLGMLMHSTKELGPAIDYPRVAAKRAMFGLQRRCQQLRIHDADLKCKLFDTLVKPILCYIYILLRSLEHYGL